MKKILKNTLLAGLVGVSSMAFAITPANTKITNTASLNYTGLTSPITASVNVTVALTPSASVLSLVPADQTAAENQSASYVYTIIAGANGSDVYNLSGTFTNTNLVSVSASPEFYQGASLITSVTLGSTAASSTGNIGDTVLNVPSDGTPDANVNNLIAGDKIVIDGNTYTIASVADNGTTATITLTTPLTTTLSVGELIPELQTFIAKIPDVGTISTTGSPAFILMDITTTSVADNTKTATDQTKTTVVEVNFVKLVRNVTLANGSGGSTTIGGQQYFPTSGGVTAKSGEVLEYALRVTAPAATAITGATMSDAIPAFTTYVASSTKMNGSAELDVLGTSPLVAGMAVNDSTSASGVVAAGLSAVVIFQVTVQ